jgi:hypothetical protein
MKSLGRSLILVLGLVGPARSAVADFPDAIQLPNGFRPEGIAAQGFNIFMGSRGTGAVYRADIRTGVGAILVPPQTGRRANGLKYDPRTHYLFVAGNRTGQAFVYNADTGANVASFVLTTEATTLINDVVVTRDAAYFTDSFRPYIYRLPLNPGGLIPPGAVTTQILMQGDFVSVPDAINLNGIEAGPGAQFLIAGHDELGVLYKVDPATGVARIINLAGASLPGNDGLLLQGHTLFAVQNGLPYQITVIHLCADFSSGVINRHIADVRFDVPSTLVRRAGSFYVVNSRNGTSPGDETTEYQVLKVPGGAPDNDD